MHIRKLDKNITADKPDFPPPTMADVRRQYKERGFHWVTLCDLGVWCEAGWCFDFTDELRYFGVQFADGSRWECYAPDGKCAKLGANRKTKYVIERPKRN